MNTKVLALTGKHVILENTLFHFRGGGQPADTGTIAEIPVIDVIREDGKIIHILQDIPPFQVDDIVHLAIDIERRRKLTYMHTVQHMLFKALEEICADLIVGKVDLDPEESSLFITGKISLVDALAAEKKVLVWITEGRAVNEILLTKEALLAHPLPGLLIKLGKIKEDPIRVIHIVDLDYSACCGTHVKNTSEIPGLFITSVKQAASSTMEIRFRIDSTFLYRYADLGRLVREDLSVGINDTLPAIHGLRKQVQILKEKVRSLGTLVVVDPTVKEFTSFTLVTVIYPSLERNDALEKLNKLKEKHSPGIFCLLYEVSKGYAFILTVSKTLLQHIDARKIFVHLQNEDTTIKGGGKEELIMGNCSSTKIILQLENYITTYA